MFLQSILRSWLSWLFIGIGLGGIHLPAPPTLISAQPAETQAAIYLPTLVYEYCSGFNDSIHVSRPRDFLPGGLAGRITFPAQCQSGLAAATKITAHGTIDPYPQGTYPWVFVYTKTRYYPQCKNARAGVCGVDYQNGAWNVPVYIGRQGIKEHFHLVLVTTDAVGNQFLVDVMEGWARAGDYPGLTPGELSPYHIEELDSIQVETAGVDP